MSSAKNAQQGQQGHVCAVGTMYNLSHAKWAWQKVVFKSPTYWPVCSTLLRSRLSIWWLSWVQKHPSMLPSTLAPASQVRSLLHRSHKISMSVSHLICFNGPEAFFFFFALFYLSLFYFIWVALHYLHILFLLVLCSYLFILVLINDFGMFILLSVRNRFFLPFTMIELLKYLTFFTKLLRSL